MKTRNFLMCCLAMFALLIAGCGGQGNNGDLTVTAAKNDNGNNTSDVAFTVTYVNSQKTDYQNTEVAILTEDEGTVRTNETFKFSSSGSLTFHYTVDAGNTIVLTAQVGDIRRSASASVTSSTLSVSPTTITFPASTLDLSQEVNILGGQPGYVASSSTADLAANVTGSVLTITLNVSATATRTGTVTVSDTAGHSATVTVTY